MSSHPIQSQTNTAENPTNHTIELDAPATTTVATNISSTGALQSSNAITIDIIGEPQQLFSSLRATMERRIQERTQSWRSNFTNVFQEMSPLVQHAQSVNNFRPWANGSSNSNAAPMLSANNFRATSNNNNGTQNQQSLIAGTSSSTSMIGTGSDIQSPTIQGGDSYVINLDGHVIQATGFAHIHPSNRQIIDNSIAANNNSSSSHHHQDTDTLLETLRRHERNTILNDATPQRNQNSNNNSSSSSNNSHHHHHHHPHNNNNANNNNNNNNIDEGPVAEAFAQIPEARAMLNTLMRYVPYISIILAKTCYDHLDGILDFIALFITFSHANWVVRQEIAKHSQRSIMKLLRELFYIILVIAVIGFMLEKRSIFYSLMIANLPADHPFTLKHLLFSVGVTDLTLKLITVGVKIIFAMIPGSIIAYKGRGRIYLITEAVSQLYRGLAPIQPWLIYLLDSYSGSEKFLGVGFAAGYMVAKGSDLVQTALFVKRAFIELLKKVSFGSKPSKDQLLAAGGQCPICHDTYTSPVLLECNHIFCELCVGTWFDREQTCPLCRAKVVDDPAFRDGATTQFVQLY